MFTPYKHLTNEIGGASNHYRTGDVVDRVGTVHADYIGARLSAFTG